MWCFTAQAGKDKAEHAVFITSRHYRNTPVSGPFPSESLNSVQKQDSKIGKSRGEREFFLFLFEVRVSLCNLSWPLNFCHSPASTS